MRGACWKLRDQIRKRDKLFNYAILHPKTNPKLVKTHSAPFWCWDKPWATLDSLDSPRPGLGGSHHLPPYSILCSSPSHLHPNGSFSRDSQSGVPKLSWFGLPGLWMLITSRPNFGLGWGLNQSCSSPRELSNGVSHFTCMHRNQVDSWLLVVGSQTANLTPSPSFDHNFCCRCPNGSCEAILDIYTLRPFQQYKKRLNVKCFDPYDCTLSFQESRRTPKSHFWECEWRPHNSLKVGLRQRATLDSLDSPRPGLGGSHHLPPYSILCSSPPHLHPNGSFSWDSQSGVPKLSRFRLPGLWTLITSRPKLGSRRGLNQSCNSPRELFNGVLHITCTHRNWIHSWLLMVGSQIASLTFGPSFDHNLCCRCPNGSCEAILDIYISIPF